MACEYAKPRPEIKSTSPGRPGSLGKLSQTAPVDWDPETHQHQESLSPSTSTTLTGVLSSEETWLISPQTAQHMVAINGKDAGCANPQSSIDMLDTRELELFGHYLSHTSRIIPYDKIDSYALQVGFPNLAFGNKPLMRSILALAAACECHDLLRDQRHHHQLGPETLAHVHELLAIADRHHQASLRQTQEAIATTSRYDCILGNAALMVLYGSASHCLRIRLAGMHKGANEPFLSDFAPVQSQWIFLIRAVHLAYVGLAADSARSTSGTSVANVPSPPVPPSRELHVTDPGAESIPPPEDGPTENTRELFLPIVITTSGAAMVKLRARARRIREAAGGGTELQACWEALMMLEKTMKRISTQEDGMLDDSEMTEPALPDVVAPWLRTYIARVTSNERRCSSPLRRTVNAFLNCVPALYVDLVRTVLDLISPVVPTSAPDGQSALQEDGLDITVAHHLALDIFAHWLVLMLLLDGVWWIGEIGSWELAKVVAFMRDTNWFDPDTIDEGGSTWWPESMHKINIELKHHARYP